MSPFRFRLCFLLQMRISNKDGFSDTLYTVQTHPLPPSLVHFRMFSCPICIACYWTLLNHDIFRKHTSPSTYSIKDFPTNVKTFGVFFPGGSLCCPSLRILSAESGLEFQPLRNTDVRITRTFVKASGLCFKTCLFNLWNEQSTKASFFFFRELLKALLNNQDNCLK